MTEANPTKSGVVALAGRPNVGKSTLLNRLIGKRLSIATPKPQTTRQRILGIAVFGRTQIAFTDTPGIHAERGGLHARMLTQARESIAGADLCCWLVSAKGNLNQTDRNQLEELRSRPLIVVINKIDSVPKPTLLPLMAEVDSLVPEAEVIPISARTGDNIDTLLTAIQGFIPNGPWLYPVDAITDQSTRFFAAELIREQLFRQLDQELPYRVAVVIDRYDEEANKDVVTASVVTDSQSSRAIIVGKGGVRIKELGIAARRAIEELTERRVVLELDVRVKKDWQKNPAFLDDIGL